MKHRPRQEEELHDAQDIWENGPRARFELIRNPFRKTKGWLSFSDRFVFFYFLIFIVLLALGVIAVLRPGA